MSPKTTKQQLIDNLFKWGIGAVFGGAILWMWNSSNSKQQELFGELVTGTVEAQKSLGGSVADLNATVEELNATVGESFEASKKSQQQMTTVLTNLDTSVMRLATCAEETENFQSNVTKEHLHHGEVNTQEHEAIGVQLKEIENRLQ